MSEAVLSDRLRKLVDAEAAHAHRELSVYDTFAEPGPGARRVRSPLPKRD
jgi:hypothetical protein